jgi:hypothetical protein
MWLIFDQSETTLTMALAPKVFQQGYPQLLWISFQATFNASCKPSGGLEMTAFLVLALRLSRLLAIGETNSTWEPSENCSIQISRTSSPGWVTATTPVMVLPIRSSFALISRSLRKNALCV